MKFTCNKDDLVNNVSIVQRAVSSNSTVQILNGILIESDNNSKIKLTGYDLQTGIEADMDADVFERGSVVLDSKFFGDIIRKLPESEVEITVNDNFQTVISCGKAEFKISGLDPETFPKIPEVDETSSDKIVMPQKILKSMINHTIFAVSRDNSRPVLTGSNIVSDGSVLSVVSIDGFRMAINRQNMGNDFPKINYIVPGKALTEMSKILSDDDDAEIILYTSMHNLLFDIGNVRMVSRLIEGNFINFDSIIAKNPKTVITINRKDFLNAVDRAALIIMTDDRKCPVRLLTSNPSELTVSAVSAQGKLQENIEVKVEGDLIDVDFNSRYILDVLKNIEDETIRVEV
ncbi:MAG: DNA polymerase III subunit beta, partial [Clostridiales bacterium]|nr:DNA polymerase III subunit beta [Clostridiales bacterium]